MPRRLTCYRYPDTPRRKSKAVKAKPVKKGCKRTVKPPSAAKAAYRSWDQKTARPAAAPNRPVRATTPGSRVGKYKRSGAPSVKVVK